MTEVQTMGQKAEDYHTRIRANTSVCAIPLPSRIRSTTRLRFRQGTPTTIRPVQLFRGGSFNVLSLRKSKCIQRIHAPEPMPHFGSRNRCNGGARRGADNGFTTKSFLGHLEPTLAICSSDYANQYDHPKQDIRDLLYEENVRLMTTKTGDIQQFSFSADTPILRKSRLCFRSSSILHSVGCLNDLIKCVGRTCAGFWRTSGGGKNSQFSMRDIGLAGFSPFSCNTLRFLSHQRQICEGIGHGRSNCQTLLGMEHIPSDNHIRTVLDDVQASSLYRLLNQTLAAVETSDSLPSLTNLDGHTLIALDGTQYFCSKANCPCRNHSTREHANGQIDYFHTVVAASVVKPAKIWVLPLTTGSRRGTARLRQARLRKPSRPPLARVGRVALQMG